MVAKMDGLDDLRLDGQVAIVTGSSYGLGMTIAHCLGSRGAKIVLNSRSDARVEKAVAELEGQGVDAIGVAADVADGREVAAMVDRAVSHFGGLDILVNNAGIGGLTPTEDLPIERWSEIIDTNLTGPFLCAQAAARVMLEKGSGVIINISSIYGQVANVQRAAYVAAKHGLDGLTKALASEWGERGLRVCSVNPGYILTPMLQTTLNTGAFTEDDLKRRTPMRRLALAEEVAQAVAYLSSPAASFITGAHLPVDGGWLAYGGL